MSIYQPLDRQTYLVHEYLPAIGQTCLVHEYLLAIEQTDGQTYLVNEGSEIVPSCAVFKKRVYCDT